MVSFFVYALGFCSHKFLTKTKTWEPRDNIVDYTPYVYSLFFTYINHTICIFL